MRRGTAYWVANDALTIKHMSQTARLYRIEQMLRDRESVTFKEMQDALEVSAATLKRDLAYLRDRLNAPIEYDYFIKGYRFVVPVKGHKYQLPSLWFAPAEIRALLIMHKLLNELDTGGLLTTHLTPLINRVTEMMGTSLADAKVVISRVKLLAASQRRKFRLDSFEVVGNALMIRKRLRFTYHGRHRNEMTQRLVSPQRLTFYRENWYLDAYCHEAMAIRKFSLDAISHAVMTEEAAKEMTLRNINEALAEGYGIYNGGKAQIAILLFKPEAARWVRHESWHARQKMHDHQDGSLEMHVPYSQDTELVMDILRHGENVVVLGPPELREQVSARLRTALEHYSDC